MPYVPTPEEFTQDLLGGTPVQLSEGVQPGAQQQNIQTLGPQAEQVQAGTQQQQAPQAAPQPSLYGSQGTTAERLFQPVQQRQQQIGQQTQQLGQTFQQQAGPTGQTFESRGGEQAVGGYVTGTYGDESQRQAAEDAARAYVNARYGGPQQLDQAGQAKVRQSIEEQQAQAKALRSGYGVQAVLQSGVPGLTRGQARYEAQQVMQDPNYRRRAAMAEAEANTAASQLQAEAARAREIAAARTNEEAEIQRRARELLQGKRTGIEADIDEQVRQRNEAENAMRAAWNKYMETGDLADLMAVPGIDQQMVAGLDSPGAQLEREAQERYRQIMNDPRYASIAEFDPLGLMISRRGREKYQARLPEVDVSEDMAGAPGYLQAPDTKKPKEKAPLDLWHQFKRGEISREQLDLLRGRQEALEEAGFAPRTAKQKEAGKYSLVNPLYFGEGVDPIDERTYANFTPGMLATRQNTADERQMEQVNRVNDLLDEVGRLEAAGDPYRAAQVAADVERYLQDEEAMFKEAGEEQSAASKKWRKAVSKARDRYQKAKGISEWGKVVKSVTGSEPLANAVGNIGYGVASGDLGLAAKGGMALPLAMGTLPLTSYANPSVGGLGRGTATGMVGAFSPAEAPRYPGVGPVAEAGGATALPRAQRAVAPASISEMRAGTAPAPARLEASGVQPGAAGVAPGTAAVPRPMGRAKRRKRKKVRLGRAA